MRIVLPADVLTTKLQGKEGDYVEILAATPNGISNRLAVFFKPKKDATPTDAAVPAKSNYTWKTPPVLGAYVRYSDAGIIEPTRPPSGFFFEGGKNVEIVLNRNIKFQGEPGAPGAPTLLPRAITHMALRLSFKDKDGNAVTLDTAPTRPNAAFTESDGEVRASVPFEEQIGKPIRDALSNPAKGLKESRFAAEFAIAVDAYILVDGVPHPIKLDDSFKIQVHTRKNTITISPGELPPPVLDPTATDAAPATDLPPALPSRVPR